MANTFKSYQQESVVTQTTVFTGPTDTQTTIIGMSIANTSASAVTASVKLNAAYIVKNAPIAVGSSLIAIGSEQKVVVEEGSVISVIASDTVDVVISTLEIS